MSTQAQKDFEIVKEFTSGYQARKDITNLPAGVLVSGSQNVQIKTNGRVGIAKGYTLDGQSGTAISAGIESAYDTDMNYGEEKNLRSYTDPATGHGVLQFRYVNPATNAVTWETLSHGLNRGLVRYTRFFDYTTEKNDLILMVDNSTNVYEWSGAVTQVDSVTANTITKQGTLYWGEVGFYKSSNKKIMINNVEYTYTGGEGTLTLTGVTPDPLANINLSSYYSETNQNTYQTNAAGVSEVNESAQSFTGVSGTLDSCKFYLSKIGAPVGNITVSVYATTGTSGVDAIPSGAALATSDPVDISTLSTSAFALTTFTFSAGNRIALAAGTTYCLATKYDAGSVVACLKVGLDTTSPTNTGNGSYFVSAPTSAWTADASFDFIYYLYTVGAPPTGSLVYQSLVTVPNSSITTLPDTLPNTYIGTLKNQVYYACGNENEVYISKVNNYKDCSVTAVRVVGEGGLLHLDANVTGLVPQENEMYISAGKDQWYYTKFTLSSDNSKEALTVERLKTGAKQGPISQEFITKDKNNVIFVSNEPVLTTLGRVAGVITTPQSNDISWPIIDDFNSYDFTGGSSKYHKNFIYVSAPTEGLIRVYNQTKADNAFWEAPITYPVGIFSVINGELYGHSFSNPETYKLFDGGSFAGSAYTAIAKFSYQNYGSRTTSKGFNQFYSEGYISSNSKLTLGIVYEIDGCSTTQTYDLAGDSNFVCKYKSDAPLGKVPLGINPLGGSKNKVPVLPPKFRWIKTFVPNYFYEHTTYYGSTGIDYNWEILAFGPRLIQGKDLNNEIKD